MNKIFLEFMSFRVPYFLGRALFFYRWMLRSPTRAGLPILDRRGLSRKTSLLGVGSTSRGCSAYRQRQKTVSSDGGGFCYKSLGAEGIGERDRKTMLAALDSYPQAQRDVLLKDIKVLCSCKVEASVGFGAYKQDFLGIGLAGVKEETRGNECCLEGERGFWFGGCDEGCREGAVSDVCWTGMMSIPMLSVHSAMMGNNM